MRPTETCACSGRRKTANDKDNVTQRVCVGGRIFLMMMLHKCFITASMAALLTGLIGKLNPESNVKLEL